MCDTLRNDFDYRILSAVLNFFFFLTLYIDLTFVLLFFALFFLQQFLFLEI